MQIFSHFTRWRQRAIVRFMAILKIARMGHPMLMRVAEPIADPQAPEIGQLIADMIDTLADAAGAGLAAPQVHVPLRLVMFHVPAARVREEVGEAAESCPFTVLINPEIKILNNDAVEDLADDMVDGLEACLSLPGLAGIVRCRSEQGVVARLLADDPGTTDGGAGGRAAEAEAERLRERDVAAVGERRDHEAAAVADVLVRVRHAVGHAHQPRLAAGRRDAPGAHAAVGSGMADLRDAVDPGGAGACWRSEDGRRANR